MLAVITALVLDLWGWESRRQAEAFRVLVQAAALLDRLLHRWHVLNIKGRSYRLKELEKLLR